MDWLSIGVILGLPNIRWQIYTCIYIYIILYIHVYIYNWPGCKECDDDFSNAFVS